MTTPDSGESVTERVIRRANVPLYLANGLFGVSPLALLPIGVVAVFITVVGLSELDAQ